jgi:methylglyoxal synthase
MTTRIALIAHDHKKDAIVELAGEYVDTLRRCDIVATGTTGTRIAEAHGLNVERMLSGPHGGDLQIGSQLAEGTNRTSTRWCAPATYTTCRAPPTFRPHGWFSMC